MYLKNIFANVYLKDVVERNQGFQSVDEIGVLVDVLASSIGAADQSDTDIQYLCQ